MKIMVRMFIMTSLVFNACIGTDYIDDPVSAQPSTRLVITPPNIALQPGQTVQLQATLVAGNGSGSAAQNVSWSSSDTTVADINMTGLVTARQVGQTRIIARTGGTTSDEALVTVVANINQVARVEVTPQSIQRRPGETGQFTATAYNLNNQILNGRTVTWVSTHPGVATINAAGLALAQSLGTAHITAVVDGIESLPAVFSVTSHVRMGTFVTRTGSGHPVQGIATLAQESNGSLTLSFGTNFSSAGGPDVRVYLSTTNTVGSNSISVGRLKTFSGAQSYLVPSGVQLNTYEWVIIHCVPFNITFGYARLQ